MAAGLDVRPTFTVNNFPDCRYINRSSSSDYRKALTARLVANFKNRNGVKLCKIISFSTAIRAAFGVTILLIIRIASWEEVGWVTAWWIIARMADKDVNGERSFDLFINRSRCQFASRQSTSAIIGFILSDPRPTCIRPSRCVNARPDLMVAIAKATRLTKFRLKSLFASAVRASEVWLQHLTNYSSSMEALQ